MKLLAGLGALGLVGGGLYASDALTEGTVYAKPYGQAYEELAAMPLLPVTGHTESSNGSMVVERAPGRIAWRISAGQMELGHFTATLSPVGADRTRVIIHFAAAPAVESRNPILSSQLMTDFARLAMVEQVDARLENRAPDLREIHWAAARHLQANPQLMTEFGTALQAQFKQVEQQLNEGSMSTAEWDAELADIKARHASPPSTADAVRPAIVFPQQ